MRLETGMSAPIPTEIALADPPTSSCQPLTFGISSALPVAEPTPSAHPVIRALLAGFFMTMAQIIVAVGLLAPEGSLSYRYSSLVQHDGFWFTNIVDRGYKTTVPPINHKVMEVSNVAFFPAYPAVAALLRYGLRFETDDALLITAQAATLGFWCYFFLFCERWNLSPTLRFFGGLAIVAHPAAFFLVAGYSESLFLMALLGFIYWSSAEGGHSRFWAGLHGMLMSGTRIVGIPCAAFPVVRSVFVHGWRGLERPVTWARQHLPAVGLMMAAMMGAGLFFLYCQLRWGHWDIYMLTQSAGWGITPDYLAVFKPSSYHWQVPALNNPTEASQMAMTIGLLLFVGAALFELLPISRRRTNWQVRIGLYFCAAIIYFVSVSGVACVEMESMLRYEFCVHVLIVLAFLHYLRQFRSPPTLIRVFGMAAVALGSAAGLSLQGWYVWNFTRGNWVA
jgi:hypothetical protein